MVKAIIFDMMGPLLQKRPDYKLDEVVQTAEHLSSQFLDVKQFVEELQKHDVTKNFSIEEIAKRVTEKYCQVSEVWNELLPKLKVKYKLAVLNNGMSITIPYFKEIFPFKDYFDIFVNSAEENLEKPGLAVYELVCKKLGVQPEECIFIDDLPENVDAARKLGMIGIVWTDFQSLKQGLEDKS